MLRLWSRLRAALRVDRTRPARRGFQPALASLEPRALLSFAVDFTATPNVLPPNGARCYLPVEIKGTAIESTRSSPSPEAQVSP